MSASPHQVSISAVGKHLLGSIPDGKKGRLLVHIPDAATINMTFVGRPPTGNLKSTPVALTADDDVTLSYYTPASDTLSAVAISNAGTTAVQVHVKADGNMVYANVASVTGTVVVTVVPILEG